MKEPRGIVLHCQEVWCESEKVKCPVKASSQLADLLASWRISSPVDGVSRQLMASCIQEPTKRLEQEL